MTAGSDTGSSNTDDTTGDSTPSFTLSCVTGSQVNLRIDGVGVATSTCAAGTVTITSTTLTHGAHTATGVQTDPAGNQSAVGVGLPFTLDLVAEVLAGIPDLQAASDTGGSNTDDITGDTTPTFDMTCTTGRTVYLYSSSTQLGSGICALGTVSITSSALTDGVYNIASRQDDEFGNISASSTALVVTISGGAPAAPGAPDLVTASDTGTSTTDNITNNNTPSFDISCVSGNIVSLYNNFTVIATTTCPVSGTSTITYTPALVDGVYANIYSTQTNVFLIESASSTLTSITVDTSAPAVTGTPDLDTVSDTGGSTVDDITGDTTPSFTLSCETNAYVTIFANGSSIGLGLCVAGTVTITSTTTLTDGSYSITATQRDTSGNTSGVSGAISITIDTTLPNPPGTPDLTPASDSGVSNTDDETNDNTPTVTISCETGNTVTVYQNNIAAGSGLCAGGTVTITLAPALAPDAVYSITAVQVDPVSLTSSTSSALTLTLDTAPASTPLTAPDLDPTSDLGASSTDDVTTDRTPTFTGSCTTGETVTLYDGVTAVGTATCTLGTYTVTASTLSVGTHSMTITFNDRANNIESGASPVLTVTIENTASGGGGGGGGGSRRKVCQDPTAVNFDASTGTINDLSKCIYPVGTGGTPTGGTTQVGGSTGASCVDIGPLVINTPIRFTQTNNVADVTLMEKFLNAYENESLTVNGIYERVDYDAVNRFQRKYASSILTPWGISEPTGYVYITTLKKIKEIVASKCAPLQGATPLPVVPLPNTTLACSAFLDVTLTQPIRLGANNIPSEVRILENFLNTYEGANILVDGIYTAGDETLVKRWQEKYAPDVLTPWNLTQGTGYFFTTSLKKMKEIVGGQCTTSSPLNTPTLIINTPTAPVQQAPNLTCTTLTEAMDVGHQTPQVTLLQNALKALGYMPSTVTSTGYYGNQTQSAVSKLQQQYNITPAQGYVGPATRAQVKTLTCGV